MMENDDIIIGLAEIIGDLGLADFRGKPIEEIRRAKHSEFAPDSLDLAEIMIEIEQRFGVEFSDAELESCKTIGDIELVISKSLNEVMK